MTEFGHTGIIGQDFCIDSWGAGPFELEVADKRHRFEDSDRFGPSKVNRNGDTPPNPWWPEGHPFWAAHHAWRKQGKRMAPDSKTCIWEPFKPTTYYLVGHEMFIVEHGDTDGPLIRISSPPARHGGPARAHR